MASTERARVSRRERPSKPALTREGIVSKAVEVMRAEGLERVTMRRLALELDTGAASLYVYVRNIGELHSAMLEDLLAAVDLGPVTAEGDWGDRVAQVMTSYGVVLLEYPSLARAMLVRRPSGPRFLLVVEGLLALLDEGEVPPDRAAWVVDLLLQFATATAAEQGIRAEAPDAQDEEDTLAAVLGAVSPQTHPHLAALSTELLSGPGEARLAWGFRVLLNGALSTPRPGPPGT